ncbi:hypothetical protein L1049_008712 [Liquidambar formosana]|uniref:Uncharacterized protein n=1 Tax=Liquidambar formosana TaxID=63359 RepID=A0AAP0X5T9_LIQFO
MRTRSQLASITPPPSPIPTGKGLRSAAVDDEILSEYLQKSLQIPDLTLPKSSFSASVHRLVPTEIDYRSIVSRERDSIDLLLRSAAEVGVFLIIGHWNFGRGVKFHRGRSRMRLRKFGGDRNESSAKWKQGGVSLESF